MKQLVSGSMVYHGNDGVKTENRLYVKKLLLALKNTKSYTRWSSHLEDNLDGDPSVNIVCTKLFLANYLPEQFEYEMNSTLKPFFY